ncbi:hypothetical protein SCAR479_02016 [Seiridium cardinale]|uniref:BTB domain-containing protein n=1 Tax=Seiridium cardinale TaxID=138064 RepID=A0ABR2Y415_9PEZI
MDSSVNSGIHGSIDKGEEMAASVKEEAATTHDGSSLQLLSPRSLFSSADGVVKLIVLEIRGEFLAAVLEPILIKYSGYFRRHLHDFPAVNTVSTIKTPWAFLEKDVLSTWLVLIHQMYYSGACNLTLKDDGEQDFSLGSLIVLAKLHGFCKFAESPIIQAWVAKKFKNTIDNTTILWTSITDQNKSLYCLQRAWLEWNDEDFQTMIVTKINKTMPDEVYDRMIDVMPHDFLKVLSRDRLKEKSNKITELEHQVKTSSRTTSSPATSQTAASRFGLTVAQVPAPSVVTMEAPATINRARGARGQRPANPNPNTPNSLFS